MWPSTIPGLGSRRIAAVAIAILGVVLAPSRLRAHHSFSADYDASTPVTLVGNVVRVEWTNPHVRLYSDVTDTDGRHVVWAVEASAPNALWRQGVRRDSVSPQAPVSIDGYRAKARAPTARGLTITFADGRRRPLDVADIKD